MDKGGFVIFFFVYGLVYSMGYARCSYVHGYINLHLCTYFYHTELFWAKVGCTYGQKRMMHVCASYHHANAKYLLTVRGELYLNAAGILLTGTIHSMRSTTVGIGSSMEA